MEDKMKWAAFASSESEGLSRLEYVAISLMPSAFEYCKDSAVELAKNSIIAY